MELIEGIAERKRVGNLWCLKGIFYVDFAAYVGLRSRRIGRNFI